MAAPKKDETQGTEATGDASGFAGRFPLQDIDIFAGGGTRGEEVELDEEALAKQAGLDKGASDTAPKDTTKKKKRFGFG
ncbi:hypothetical protein [Paraliomyxa miuraensis]|uniref:hypothetical protein n=1 Tax=Paraliomyxa miuraensis TaxID=376150 RepID=UPI00225368BC|nr:hypothetical protein [Paraliomyxa miuraensis]MCX4244912.1 hypothetical protein [Paraliomyxa miuraensis]